MSIRQEKVAELLTRLAAEYTVRETSTGILVTVTHASVSSDLKNATIYITVLPESNETAVLEFLSRKEYDFKEYIRKGSSLRFIPQIVFKSDEGEKNRIAIEDLSRQ